MLIKNNFDGVDFSECHSEEVIRFFRRTVYYSWFIKHQDLQPMAELLTTLHVWIAIRCIHINIKYKFTNKLYNKLESSHIESDNKNA